MVTGVPDVIEYDTARLETAAADTVRGSAIRGKVRIILDLI